MLEKKTNKLWKINNWIIPTNNVYWHNFQRHFSFTVAKKALHFNFFILCDEAGFSNGKIMSIVIIFVYHESLFFIEKTLSKVERHLLNYCSSLRRFHWILYFRLLEKFHSSQNTLFFSIWCNSRSKLTHSPNINHPLSSKLKYQSFV